MLRDILILLPLLFSASYPLSFWISYDDPLRQNFHRFHIGMPAFVAGVAAVSFLILGVDVHYNQEIFIWTFLMFLTGWFYWNKLTVNPVIVTAPCLLGIGIFIMIQNHLLGAKADMLTYLTSILGGLTFSLMFYAMNLGHWYLNVHGLSIKHLMRTVYVIWGLVLTRLVVDTFVLLKEKVLYAGDLIPAYDFIFKIDGFLVTVGLFFGVVLPCITLYFVKETLKVKSTQSATGILYVLVVAVLIGEVTFKYYLLKFGLSL